MKRIKEFVKKETVLTVAWILAIASAFLVPPTLEYAGYIDWRSLGILWSLMIIMKGLQINGVFEGIGLWLLVKTKRVWQLSVVLIFLCFLSSMFITNDVALITFVPFAIMMLRQCDKEKLLIPVIVLQTIAANLGSMLTPIGNPQNLYLYGLSGMDIEDFLLWMLPGTSISLILIVTAILFIKGKNDVVEIKRHELNKSDIADSQKSGEKADQKDEKIISHNAKITVVCCYIGLFVIALLTVMKVIDFRILVLTVLIIVLCLQNKVLTEIDYALLFTFVGFFIFTGNMGRVTFISDALSGLVKGRELVVGVIASQGISNVPAALLLSGFTDNIKELLYGVNLGGLGTLIASMASLISYKSYAHEYNETKGKYILVFTAYNVVFLAILMVAYYLLGGIIL